MRASRKTGRPIGRPPAKFCPRGHDMAIHRTVQSGRPWCGICKNLRWKAFRYGITVEQYEELMAAQDHRCAICRNPWGETRWNGPCVDHDHETKAVRSILCRKCNIAIGHLDDDPIRMRAAADYVEKHRKFKVIPAA